MRGIAAEDRPTLSKRGFMKNELPIVFECEDCRLIGIISKPVISVSDIGVVIVVGGPQYRSGSHRQFTLLSRQLADNGYFCFRFDYRGMGDSEGGMRDFERINLDICSAVDAFISSNPSIGRIVLWGLCDAASAILYYAHTDDRIAGIVLLNPWVHTMIGEEQARLKHYYLSRLWSPGFWQSLVSGKIDIIKSGKELIIAIINKITNKTTSTASPSFVQQMQDGFSLYPGKTLLILSGDDLVAQEFQQLLSANQAWAEICQSSSVEKIFIKEANHTFSSQRCRDRVANDTVKWLKNFERASGN